MISRATLRLHAVAMAAASWLVFLWAQAIPGAFDRFGMLRGVDFVQFYTAGWFVQAGRTDELYDWVEFARRLPALVPGIGDLLFLPIYPPQVALAFAPLGRLSYLPALGIWTVASIAMYMTAVWLGLRRLPPLSAYRLEAWCFALGFPPFLQLIAHGQISAAALLLLVGALLAFRADRPWLVGLALGSLVYKPQLGTFALAACVLWPSWRLIGGLVVGAGVQIALVFAVLGGGALVDYAAVLRSVVASAEQFEPKVWAMHSLRGALELLVGQSRLATVLWGAGIVAVLWLARRAWDRDSARELRFAVLCVAGLVLNPHLYVYDLVLLAIPLACVASWLVERQDAGTAEISIQRVAYALVWLPLIGPLAAITHVQLTSPAMIALLWMLGGQSVGRSSLDRPNRGR